MSRKAPALGESDVPTINRTLQYFAALLLAIIIALTVVQLELARIKLIGSTRLQMFRMDVVLAEQTGRALETVDFILRSAMETAQPHGMGPDAAVDLLMAHRIEDVRQVSEIAIAAPSGRIAFSSRPGGPADLPAAAGPLLAYHASHDDSTVQVSEPFRDGDGQWRMLLTRRMTGPSGQFLGIGAAFVDLAYFQDFYRAVQLGNDGTIILHRDDGVILARSPPDDGAVGARYAASQKILPSTTAGTLETNGQRQGGARIMAIHELRGLPLAISVSVSRAKVLAAWWQQVWVFTLACLIACAVLAGLLLQLLRRSRQVALLIGQMRAQRDRAEAVNRDLSEQIGQREQAEAALQETNAKLHRQEAETADANKWLGLAEQIAHIGHWRLSVPDMSLVWSPEIYRMFGQPMESFRPVHGSPALNYHADDQQIINRAVAEAIVLQTDFQVRVRIDRPDGSICHTAIRGIPQIGPDGTLNSLFGVIVDRTEQHRSEEQLRQSEKVQVVGRLAAGVAHDFNNILQVIISNLEMIDEDLPPQSPAAVYSRNALEEAMRGADLTHHLLSYTRQQVLTPSLLELPGLLSEVQVILVRTLGSRVTLDLAVEPMVAWVRADRAQLQTALMNLAINAAHAMPDGGVLRLEAYSAGTEVFGEIKPGRYVAIAVTDTGSGMTPEVLDRAFDPFFTTKGLEGTGLGLAMVQGFSRQSGGDVRILSVPGEGTRVEIWLPAVLPEGNFAAALPARRANDAGRVLLVDDQPSVLALEATILRKAGFSVSEAPSGAGALALLAEGKRFDTIVTDYMMPGMTGVDLIQRVRVIQPALPAVIVTGYTELAEFDPARHGAVLIHKPFKREALVAQIRELVDAARRHGAPARVPL